MRIFERKRAKVTRKAGAEKRAGKAESWANYYWAIITRFKRFNVRILDEFQEAQDDHKNHLKRPQTHIFLAGSVPKMCPKKVAGLSLVPVAIGVCWYKPPKVPT